MTGHSTDLEELSECDIGGTADDDPKTTFDLTFPNVKSLADMEATYTPSYPILDVV
jgi:hypothetical protein